MIFEHIIRTNNVDVLVFIANNYLGQLSTEFERLFMVSAICGKVEIIQYLLQLGAPFDIYCNRAFVLACIADIWM